MTSEQRTPRRVDRFFSWVERLILAAISRPALVLASAIVLAVVGGRLAANLRVDTDLAKLLPSNHPSVVALERLRRTVGAETHAAVIIESPRLEASQAFAQALIPRLLEQRQRNGEPYFTRIEYRRDVEFLKKNALYLATDEELDTLERYLRRRIEEARLETNPMFVDLLEEDEQPAAASADEARVHDLRQELLPKEYPVSDDGRVMVLRLFLTGSKADLGYVDAVFAVAAREIRKLNPAGFDPELKAQVAGPLLRHRVEMHAIDKDVFNSVGTGMIAVLLVVAAYFFLRGYQVRRGTAPTRQIILSELARTPVAALVIGLPLGMSLAWTFGLAYLRFGALNLITATLALVLFGLGIDFGIHIYARYTEERGAGFDPGEGMRRTLAANVQPVLISGSTTVAGFGLLTLAQFRGFSEFGYITGIGLVFALVAMLVVLPALLLLLERAHLLHLESAGPAPPSGAAARRWPLARVVVAFGLVSIAVAAHELPGMRFEWNFSRLEPKFPETDHLEDLYHKVYPPGGRNPAYVLVDTPEEVPPVVAAVRELMARDQESPTIKSVETLQERFPLDPAAQRAKLERIGAIRGLLDDKYLRRVESEDVSQLRTAAAVREPIPLTSLPENLRAQFTARDGTVGNFVMIYPLKGMSDGRNSMAFADDVKRITTADGRVYDAASSPLVSAEMLRVMRKESPIMVLLTVGSLVLLVPFAFRRLGLAALALMPLTVSVVWMLAINAAWDMGFNFYNLVVLPTVLGMGEDAGVHLVHRWVEEGHGSVRRIMASTGEAVTICAITAMLGFSGMLTSFHPGLRSMGVLAVAGLGSSLIASLVLLPAVLQVIDDRRERRAQRTAAGKRRGAAADIVAILAVRNEVPFLRRCLEHLESEGVAAVVIDNGSTDGTAALAKALSPRLVSRVEHLPYTGCNDMQQRHLAVDRLRRTLGARWVILHSADELLTAARPGESLREAILRADREGATVVNFEEYVFVYEDRDVDYEGTDYYRSMKSYYLFVPRPLRLMRAFRNDLAFDASTWDGHTIGGGGVAIHPENLVLRHYIALSRRAAIRKLVARPYPAAALARGWHGNRVSITAQMLEPPDPDLLSRWESDPRALDGSRPYAQHFWEWPRG